MDRWMDGSAVQNYKSNTDHISALNQKVSFIEKLIKRQNFQINLQTLPSVRQISNQNITIKLRHKTEKQYCLLDVSKLFICEKRHRF